MISILHNLIVFGSIGFWVLFFIYSIILIAYSEQEDIDSIFGTHVVTAIFLGIVCTGNIELLKSISINFMNNPLLFIGIFIGYLVAGTIWSFFKWFFYLHDIKDNYAQYIGEKYSEHHIESFRIEKYKVSENKTRLIAWMMYWPFFGVWTLINNPVKKAFNWILKFTSGFYDKMTESVLGNVVEEKLRIENLREAQEQKTAEERKLSSKKTNGQ